MKNFIQIVAGLYMGIAALGMMASSAHAALIDNGASTIDTLTGLEWLDVTATLDQSYNSVIGGFGGYIASGYHVATRSEVCELFGALGDTITNCGTGALTTSDSLAPASALEFISKLGVTNVTATQGWFDGGNLTAAAPTTGLGCINTTNPGCLGFTNNADTRAIFLALSSHSDSIGGWLVRNAQPAPPDPVPEPATLFLMGLGLAGLGFARRIKLNA